MIIRKINTIVDTKYLTLTKETLYKEHICCAFSDKKCAEGYEMKSGDCEQKDGLVVYYTDRCPFTDYYVRGSLLVLAQEKNIPLKIIKLKTMEQAQACPSPALI